MALAAMTIKRSIIFIAACLMPWFVGAQNVGAYEGSLTGKSYLALPAPHRMSYAAGYLDAALAATLFGAPEKNIRWIATCTKGMSVDQVRAIFDKFLADNPVRWHDPMNATAHAALVTTCKPW